MLEHLAGYATAMHAAREVLSLVLSGRVPGEFPTYMSAASCNVERGRIILVAQPEVHHQREKVL